MLHLSKSCQTVKSTYSSLPRNRHSFWCRSLQMLPVDANHQISANFFRNLSRYDHILKNLRLLTGEKLSAIARTDKTFSSFSIAVPVRSYKDKTNKIETLGHSLRFLDSLQFMSQSLDSLAKTLQTKDFVLLRQHCSHVTEDLFQKRTKWGHFPYNFWTVYISLRSPLTVR